MTVGAFLSNFGFEYEIAGRDVPRVVRLQADRFSHILRLVPGFRDANPFHESIDPDRVVAWGPSPAARAAVGDAAASWPPDDVVRQANDKRTSHALEVELRIALEGSCIVASLADVQRAATELGGPWLAKHPWGVAGRERVTGEGDRIDHDTRRALARLLDDAGELVFEPRVTIDDEFSVHYDCGEDGVTRVGAARLLTDRGVFRGNEAPMTIPRWADRQARQAAEHVAALGWVGPVGIDGFTGSFKGRPIRRGVCEINARWSFGRLTLELHRRLGGSSLTWHHPGRTGYRPELEPVGDAAEPGEFSLPEWCDPGGKSGTWLKIR